MLPASVLRRNLVGRVGPHRIDTTRCKAIDSSLYSDWKPSKVPYYLLDRCSRRQKHVCQEDQDVPNHPPHSSNLCKGGQSHVHKCSKRWQQIHPDCKWLQSSLVASSTFLRSCFTSSLSYHRLVSNLASNHNPLTCVPLLTCFPVFLSSGIPLGSLLCFSPIWVSSRHCPVTAA